MHEQMDLTAWSCMLLGLYTMFAGIGALRRPTMWQTMIREVCASPSLQVFSAFLELTVGSLIYLANPWVTSDILSCVGRFFGGCMILEALMIAGFCDIYCNLWMKPLAQMPRGWAILTTLLGLCLAVPAMLRFG